MNFDIFLPTLLFTVTLLSMYLSKKTERKLSTTVEEKKFRVRDILLLIILITTAVSVVVFIPTQAILALFLFSYSALLFIITYIFSGVKQKQITLFLSSLIIISICAAATGFFFFTQTTKIIGVLAFLVLAFLAFLTLIYTQKNSNTRPKWHVALFSPILFLLFFFFFNKTKLWFPHILNVYALLFVILIIMYLGALFTWKTTLIFAGLLTLMDIILVWGTGTMLPAAETLSNLGLPVLVAFPTIPFIYFNGSIQLVMLGLGDFFFAGILATQTRRKFNQKTAIISIFSMSLLFGIFMLLILNPTNIIAIPATLPIVFGWLPIIIGKFLQQKRNQPVIIPKNTPI